MSKSFQSLVRVYHAISKCTRGGLRPLALLTIACVWLTLPGPIRGANVFDTGTITGIVTDPSGAVIPGATVTITDTGISRQTTVQTNGDGNFVAPGLPFGNYVVSATATNFGKSTTKPLVLSVGATVRVHLGLSITVAAETVEVTGSASEVDTTTASSGTTLNETQIRNLPTNGRDLMDFLEIAPGSVNSIGTFQGSVNGQENFFTGLNVTLDGQNASRGDVNGFDETEGNEQARLTRGSVDSVQEIDFSNSGYSAEVGHSLGPQMNIITKGGTNRFHGEVFDYFRNDALDAKDYFSSALTSPKQPLRMQQFGGNLGGPIVKNKLFFFGNYEAIRQRTTTINSLNETPSAYVRSLFVPSMQPVLAQLAPLPAGCTTIPAPNSCAVPGTADPNNLPEGAQLVYNPSALQTTLREDSGAIRVDYEFSQRDRIFARYSIDDSLTNQQTGLNEGQTTPLYLRTQYAMINETHTFSPSLINEASLAVNKFYSDTNSDTPQPLTGFSGFFVNLGSLPGASSFNQITPFTVFEVLDNATKTVGNHTIKFGAQIRVNRLNEFLRQYQNYEFASFPNLEDNQPFVLAKIGYPGFVGVRNSNWDLYAEDDWQVTPKLSLNLGIRTGINTVWSERNNQEQNFDFATQSFLPATQPAYSGPTVDIAPRLGVAYDVTGRGKTVLHAYFGTFYNPMHFGFGLVSNLPAYQSYNVNVFQVPIVYPEPNPPLPAGTQNVNIFPQHPADPRSRNWLVGIQQQLARNTVMTVNYTGNQDSHMQAGVDFAAINLNPGNYVTQARPLPAFANENLDSDTLGSSYNALQVQVRHNTGRLNAEVNYTWSHEIDDMINVFNGFSDPYDPTKDRGTGDWDIRHNITGSLVYSLPDLRGSNSLVRGVFGGWQASSIVQARSGGPVNVTIESGIFGLPVRPDTTGLPIKLPNFSWPYHSYNPAAYQIEPTFNGTPGDPSAVGNVGRNSLRAPGFVQWDLSGMKNFPVTSKVKAQFRVDVFNILNHPNFGNPDGGICTAFTAVPETPTATCTPNTNFGLVAGTIADTDSSQIGTGTARQEQFSLKLIF